MLAFLLVAAVAAVREADTSSPVARVLDLLRNLKTDVTTEGEEEATAYDQFSCFCKEKTGTKVGDIETRELHQKSLEASLKQLNARKVSLSSNVDENANIKAAAEKSLGKATELRGKENEVYQEMHTDTSNAAAGIDDAIASISGSKATFLQIMPAPVQKALALAQAAGLKTNRQKVVQLLQIVPENQIPEAPTEDYSFHSDGIVQLLGGLKTEWDSKKTTLENEETAAAGAFNLAADAKRGEISAAGNEVNTDTGLLDTCNSDIARDEVDLTETLALLVDDRAYLKDLTDQCERKAREWDQRSVQRKGELTALTSAIDIIGGTVLESEGSSSTGARAVPALLQGARATPAVTHATDKAEDDDTYSDVVFIQKAAVRSHESESRKKLRNQAITELVDAGEKIHSEVLSMAAMKMAADPFAKVKTLIQGLVERLLKEAADEATHKGWCDTEIAHAESDRQFRHEDVTSLSSQIAVLEARKAALEQTAVEVQEDITNLGGALSDATGIRDIDRSANRATLAAAQTGLAALKDAIKVLQGFYGKASRSTVSLLQVQTEGSPVSSDLAEQGLGHSGAYQGNQAAAGGILGMLATIQSDFERTIKTTTDSEYQAERDFTKFKLETNSSIHSQTRGLEQTNTDLTVCNGDLVAALNNLRENQGSLDDALRMLEKLRPACIDTGMSWEEKVEKRNAEITALKNALCKLDEEDNEYPEQCAGTFLF